MAVVKKTLKTVQETRIVDVTVERYVLELTECELKFLWAALRGVGGNTSDSARSIADDLLDCITPLVRYDAKLENAFTGGIIFSNNTKKLFE